MSHHKSDKRNEHAHKDNHGHGKDEAFGSNDTGAEEEKEWIDGLSDDE